GTRQLVEAAGAAALAAAMKLRERLAGRRIALVCSGGNITLPQLRDLLGAVGGGPCASGPGFDEPENVRAETQVDGDGAAAQAEASGVGGDLRLPVVEVHLPDRLVEYVGGALGAANFPHVPVERDRENFADLLGRPVAEALKVPVDPRRDGGEEQVFRHLRRDRHARIVALVECSTVREFPYGYVDVTAAISLTTECFALPNSIVVWGSSKSSLSMPANPGAIE